jgi:hypothetical protein
VAQEIGTASTEPKGLDTVASDACTRSGAFALLLSLALFALIPYWMQRPVEVALANYLANRVNLSIYVSGLNDDPVWQKYRASQPTAESMSIAQLLDARVELSSSSTAAPQVQPGQKMASGRGHRPSAQQHGRNAPGPPGLVPAPPTGLSATLLGSIDRIHSIAGFLTNLNDPDVLTKSRGYSNFFSFSITRWLQKRNDLLYANVLSHSCTMTPLELPHKRQQPPNFVPALDTGAMLRCLTLHDVREVAEFELPPVTEPTQIGRSTRRDIDVSPGALPRDLNAATIIAQVLLFFVTAYFGAYAREAVSSPAFPAQGTLFGSYCRSPLTLLVFFLALWTPLIASLAVAAASREWPELLLTVFVFCAALPAHLTLQRKSYFAPLSPRLLAHWRG